MNQLLQTPIEFLKGVGPQRAELLQKEIGIFTFKEAIQSRCHGVFASLRSQSSLASITHWIIIFSI